MESFIRRLNLANSCSSELKSNLSSNTGSLSHEDVIQLLREVRITGSQFETVGNHPSNLVDPEDVRVELQEQAKRKDSFIIREKYVTSLEAINKKNFDSCRFLSLRGIEQI